MMQWAMGEELPIEAEGSGGRQVYPDDPDRYGNIYDHFAIVYKWANGARGYHFSRQQNGPREVMNWKSLKEGFLQCQKQACDHGGWSNTWRYSERNNDMYKTEHEELIAPFARATHQRWRACRQQHHGGNHGAYGRLHREEAILPASPQLKEDLTPPHLDFNQPWPYRVPKPGLTKFI